MNDWCFPIVQNVQRVFPGASVKDPQAQLVHVLFEEAPVAAEYLPAAQLVHTVLPVVAVYVPAVQATHDPDFPPDIQYVPAAQQVHGAISSALTHPSMHAQLLALVPPTKPFVVKGGQDVHSSLPAEDLYLPAAHAQQVEPAPVPSQSVCPATHE